MSNHRITYAGLALPTNGTTVNLFTEQGLDHKGLKWYALNLRHSHAGTVEVYARQSDEDDWELVQETAVTPGDTPSRVTCYVETFRDLKVDFVNGSTTQTTFKVDQVLTCEEPISTLDVTGEVSVEGGTINLDVDPDDVLLATGAISGVGSLQLVAAVPGSRIVVHRIMVTNSHATVVTLVEVRSGAGTPAIEHAAAPLGGGWKSPEGMRAFKCDAGEALNAESSAAATVQLSVWYSLEAA
jgi:hypothetical protein